MKQRVIQGVKQLKEIDTLDDGWYPITEPYYNNEEDWYVNEYNYCQNGKRRYNPSIVKDNHINKMEEIIDEVYSKIKNQTITPIINN